jgi:hypothetical protein
MISNWSGPTSNNWCSPRSSSTPARCSTPSFRSSSATWFADLAIRISVASPAGRLLPARVQAALEAMEPLRKRNQSSK